MPLLEPMRAFSGRMRDYYSGSRFAYIRLSEPGFPCTGNRTLTDARKRGSSLLTPRKILMSPRKSAQTFAPVPRPAGWVHRSA